MTQVQIKNPIIPGFNPDPNILKVADVYYIAVSSFEWMPGIRIYQSHDLVNWEFLTDILTTQIDLRGNPQGASIWAPQISYDQGTFYLTYTDVKNAHGPFKDCHNYLVTAPTITGPWSDSIYLNSSGFDPALFHDPNGKKWFVNEIWDYRLTTSNKSAGVVLQEYDLQQQKLVGKVYKIFNGTALAKTEAPQIYLHNSYYYLITAEGGTGKNHSVTVCRSKTITGPYVLAPNSPILTASDKPNSPLQCTGHASLVESNTGHWYMVFLTCRILDHDYHILGRETAIEEVYWTKDGWLESTVDGNGPDLTPTIEISETVQQVLKLDFEDNFDQEQLTPGWNFLRVMPDSSWLQLRETEKQLRIYGGESPASTFNHHLVAIRQSDFNYIAETELNFTPKTFNEFAGIMLFLTNEKFIYLYVTYDEQLGTVLRLMKYDQDQFQLEPQKVTINKTPLQLRIVGHGLSCAMYYKNPNEQDWHVFKEAIDTRFLSGGFTGNFIGISVTNLNQTNASYADFDYFNYRVLSDK
ncbi:glycoside hydrolase family 43 protein [Lapidilactobacillus bayanensis]|uniref:glycoside hydrolase family 43 protein n=1 Tax=Lapidilactobacillus bayanensis TaxID=2485998 RepID=UPI000F7A4B61|nr:glycoside hydrolase family 43 protein [Lapidilactobacillus bayanensis]